MYEMCRTIARKVNFTSSEVKLEAQPPPALHCRLVYDRLAKILKIPDYSFE